MTHLSDFSYLERCTIWTYISVYFLYSVYMGDKFKCLTPKSIISGELKSIITMLLMMMLLMQFMWDAASTYVKYTEGFYAVSPTIIITKSFDMWSSSHQTLMMAMDYVECVTFSLQTGVLFLMQSFWNYLSNTYARKSFMGSLEFKFYILWALASMAMFPILQWVYRNDVFKREAIPQLAYGCEAMVAAVLGVRSHLRFKKIICLSDKNNGASNKIIVTRLSYFKDMNLMITIILFLYAASFIIVCSDGLTTAKVINSNKFAMDTVIANVNICTVFILLLLISIFHPRPQYTRELLDANRNDAGHIQNTNARTGRAFTNADAEDAKYIGTAVTTDTKPYTKNGGFMRPMSPVAADYPGSDTTLLDRPADKTHHSVAIEDPYSNKPIMFSMVDTKQSRYDTTLKSLTPHYESTSPTRIGRPPWERKPSITNTDQSGEKKKSDWL